MGTLQHVKNTNTVLDEKSMKQLVVQYIYIVRCIAKRYKALYGRNVEYVN